MFVETWYCDSCWSFLWFTSFLKTGVHPDPYAGFPGFARRHVLRCSRYSASRSTHCHVGLVWLSFGVVDDAIVVGRSGSAIIERTGSEGRGNEGDEKTLRTGCGDALVLASFSSPTAFLPGITGRLYHIRS